MHTSKKHQAKCDPCILEHPGAIFVYLVLISWWPQSGAVRVDSPLLELD